MHIKRHFLGWDAPATVKVREFLLPQELSGPVELGKDLIVVPTRQAGRWLREALARQCSLKKIELRPPQVVEPSYFLKPEDSSGTIAESLEVAATWAEILMNIDPQFYSGLLPSYVPSQDFLWALHTGEMIERLRSSLADGGYSITDIHNEFGDILEELERWGNLAELETAYLNRLAETGRRDPVREMLRQVESPQPPKGIERIVVAAVPDPTPLMVKKLERLSSHLPITILIHAPESLADCFDKWGRPVAAKWRERHISIPDPEANILLSGTPRLQSRKVIELMAGEEGHFGPADVAIGVPDKEVIPFLEADLEENGLVAFNPAGKPAESHPLTQLLGCVLDFATDGDYPSASALFRNRDFLEYLNRAHHPHPSKEKGLPSHSSMSSSDEKDEVKDASLDSRLRGNDSSGVDYDDEGEPNEALMDTGLRRYDNKKNPYDSKKGGYDGIMPSKLLEELDKYQNERLPQSLGIMSRDLTGGEGSGKIRDEFPSLAKAGDFLGIQVRGADIIDAVIALRSFLQAIYKFRTINSGKPEDNDFAEVAGFIDEALHLMSESPLKEKVPGGESILEMLLWHLSRTKYNPEPEEGTVIDLEGWMELPWNDAPFLLVTGMNEGAVPDCRPEDIFLPDTLRRQLKLPHDDDRLAVFSYQMTALIESRREQGRVCFIAGKTGGGGDTLKPSRLLLRCEDSELPHRARRLFDTPPEPPENYPSDISFMLEASPPSDVPDWKQNIKRMAVTAFRDYLNCPFRFYLKRVLDMEAIDDLKTELDAMDFGSLVHDVLYDMACDEEMRQCEKVSLLQDFLIDRTGDWIKARLGPLPPVQVEAQIESARQRLQQAAEIQIRLIQEGWEIVSWERPIQGHIDGMLIRGKIDRIDRHRKTGKIMVLDYKTSENASTPEDAHFGPLSKDGEYQDYVKVDFKGRTRRWADLQLPLYAILLSSEGELSEGYNLGYFNLPRSVNDTGVVLWEDFSPDILESARRCASGVISDIKNRRFWPPATKLRYDDFEALFPAEPSLCVNSETFAMFMNEGRLL